LRTGSLSSNGLRAEYLESGIIDLLPYQRRWVEDQSRFKIGLWARQTGKTFSSTLEACLDAYEGGNDWVFLSAGERQSKEMIRRAKSHVTALNMFSSESTTLFEAENGTTYKQLEIELKRGTRILALAANPDTARGNSANVVLDEYAFQKDSRAIWAALFPTITRGYKIRIMSTPQGRQNKFYEIWSGNPKFSKHRVDIYEAYAQGLKIYGDEGEPVDPEFLKNALDDAEAWAQEYEVKFLDEATAWLPYDLISEAEDQSLGMENPWGGGEVYAGIDIGRKKHLTVYWSLEQSGDVLRTLRIVEIERERMTHQFNQMLQLIGEDNPRRVCIDSTGLGRQISEDLQAVCGSHRVEPVEFHLGTKQDLAVRIKQAFEDKLVLIPIDRKIREDLHRVRKIVTKAGNVRFDAERTEDSHSDRFWALALALHAASAKDYAIPQITMASPRTMLGVVQGYGLGLNAHISMF